MGTLLFDLKFGARLLWKDKGFALTTIATLAICLGANATIFSVIDSVLLSPLPVPESGRIVLMYNSYPNAGVERASNGVPDYYDRLNELSDLFEEQTLFSFPGLTVGELERPERVTGMAVTPSFFRLLRIGPRLGRIFSEEEGEPGNERKVMLSYSSWQQLYGGDDTALGKDLRIDGNPYTIIGVMPEDFFFLDPDVRVWIPLAFTAEQKSDQRRHNNNWENIGRLKEGATLGRVRAQIDALTAANLDRFPEFKEILINAGYHVQAHFLKDEVVRDVRGTLYLLWGGVFFVLLIGCVNIANLALARSSVRLREMATRFCLGAGRWRVTRQLLTESVLLTLLGGSAGLLLGYWGLNVLRSLGLDEIPRGSEIRVSGTDVGFIIALAVVVGILIGAIPVGRVLGMDLNSVLREEGRTGTSGRAARAVRSALVVAQVAFALILLIGAGLLLTSFRQVLSIDPGFRDGHQVLTGRVNPPETRYADGAALRAFQRQALERIRSLPGVTDAGITTTIPFGRGTTDSVILAEGYVMEPGESLVSPNNIVVTPGYFEAMGIRLLRGRYFDERDTTDSLRTIIVDERLAKKFWPDKDPLGRRMYFPSNPQDLLAIDENTRFLTVVGVVGSVKLRALVDPDERVGAYYFPYQQDSRRGITFAIKTPTDPNSLIGPVRAELAAVDPELPFHDVHTMQERLDESLITRRSPMLLTLAFGAVALFLAAVGIYGVLAYLVAQRTREIGIRIALGASTRHIFQLVFREGLSILVLGLVLGAGGAMATARFVQSLLYGVRPLEPAVLLGACAVLTVVALTACAAPARRATGIDAVSALQTG